MTYVIIRYGSNGANQSCCNRAVLGTVNVRGTTTATRRRELLDRVGSSLAGTIHATTTFRQDNGDVWHAYHNQYFRWIAAARAKADDWRAARVADEAYVESLI